MLPVHLLPQLLFPQAAVHLSPAAEAVAPVAGLVDPILVVQHAEPGSRRAARLSFRPRRLVLVVELSGATHQTMLVYLPCRVQYPGTRIEW
jgi:hypothetical protein